MGDNATKQQFCLPGLQGFPVQISDWQGRTEKRVIPNDITLQFLDAPVPFTFGQNGLFSAATQGSTFFLGGTQYSIRGMMLTNPTQQGLKNFSAEPLAEVQIWGISFNRSQGIVDGLGVLVIPIRITSDLDKSSLAAQSLVDATQNKAVRFANLIPAGKTTEVIRYSTCVEVENRPSINIQVAYWPDGAMMPQSVARTFTPIRSQSGLPNIFNGKSLSSFDYNEVTKEKTNLQFRFKDINRFICEVYPSKVLSATSTEVSLVFGTIKGFITSAPRELRTAGYKCIAIDRMRDIQNGKLVVDPATGQRLDQVVQEAEEETKEIDIPVPPNEQVSVWRTVAIVLGVLLGITVIALIVYWAQTFFVDRKTTELPELSGYVQTAQKYTNSINEAPAVPSATTTT
jgi:hypothetical protein